MNLSNAELFLMAWAICATVVAGLFMNTMKKADFVIKGMMKILVGVAEEELSVSLQGNKLTVKVNKNGNQSSLEVR